MITNTKYTTGITVSKPPSNVFNAIIDLKRWWVEKFSGEDIKLNAEFELTLGEGHYSKNKVLEFVPDKKFVWVTTESKRTTDDFDWTGTKMIFELSPTNKGTQITFTYDGVVLESDQDKLKDICDYCIKDLLYKHLESFTTTIAIAQSPQKVFKCLKQVTNWWSNDFEGSSNKLNDEFTIHHLYQHYSKQKIVELIPDKKMVWLVTDSTLYWLQRNKHEWTNTKMIFDLTTDGDKTILHFTHEGLTPEKECYTMCEKGWTMIVSNWLLYFINTGTPSPELAKAAAIRNEMLTAEQNNISDPNFTRTITAHISAAEAIHKISKVTDWWGVTRDGNTEKLNDKFVIKMGGDSFFNMTISELIPDKKVVWLVTDCNMPWYNDKKEWQNTRLIFDLSENNGITELTFTHEGLTPEKECWKDCDFGWNHWITRSLFSYFTIGKGDFKQR